MAEREDPLDLILEEVARIHKVRGSVHSDYHHGRVLMLESADQLDGNVGKALKTMRKARESFEQESVLARRYNSFKAKWALMAAYQFGDPEKGLEIDLQAKMKEGEFEDCQPILAELEKLLDQDVSDSIEIGMMVEVPNPVITMGRGTTLSITLHNHCAFPIQVESLSCTSAMASIYVLDFYKGEMRPADDRTFQINVIPKVEGDIPVDVEAVVENDSRMLRIKKGFSLKVEAPTQVVQVVQMTAANQMQYVAQPSARPASTFDPLELVVSGTVDQWTLCIRTFAQGKGPIDLTGMVQTTPEFVRSDGYANLFKALLTMSYDRSVDWTGWFNDAGIMGEDYTKRCAKLIYRMASAPDRTVGLEMDGSVGSSNIENLIGAMQIASGEVKREERSRKSWRIDADIQGKSVSFVVEKTIDKDEKGKARSALFRMMRSD